ncbi:MAG: hypothetical protein H0W65_11555 [Sphingomonas sp.]|uniref:hypothetical protein n=1 Tax=Sphingomonas sp. TaxID=28214 RepID=UPI0017B8A2E6|nr:hypothetical protein [Sphingomonas sp.]MBA3668336.1 hypothetical protein [Sphingomonas sp.]
MDWGLEQHPIETLAIWAAPAVLAAASCWSATVLLGGPGAVIAALGLAYLIGITAMRVAGSESGSLKMAPFEPLPFDNTVDELLLDDPLGSVEPDARVSRLFAPDERTPGALVMRIADYLGDRPAPAFDGGSSNETRPLTDASAALHAALANIRASLR